MLKKIKLENFTVFDSLEMDLSQGINIFIGENGTGKTHLLKVLYAVLFSAGFNRSISKIDRVFLPKGRKTDRLVRRMKTLGPERADISLYSKDGVKFEFSISKGVGATRNGSFGSDGSNQVIFIPVKEMLANAPGFRSLYDEREVHFEEVYVDILKKSFLPPLKVEKIDKAMVDLMKLLEKAMHGRIEVREETFYLEDADIGEVEFTLLAEGVRKLGLLWRLMRNGSLKKGSILFWDEPEANLNPNLMRVIVEVLLGLERAGVQIFLATHSYVLLKEFDLQQENHSLLYHSLHKENGAVRANSTGFYQTLLPNPIGESFDRLYDLEVRREFGGKK